jgi:hypothetical protein
VGGRSLLSVPLFGLLALSSSFVWYGWSVLRVYLFSWAKKFLLESIGGLGLLCGLRGVLWVEGLYFLSRCLVFLL